MDPVKTAQDPAIAPLLANLSPDEQADVIARIVAAGRRQGAGGRRAKMHIAEGSLPAEHVSLWNNYYSVVRFQATVGVVGAVSTLTWAVQTLRPFSYRINDALTSAGFDPTLGNATEAETNLVTAGQTVSGELVKVMGLSLMPSSVTDIEAWKLLIANMSVVISMNGDQARYRLGRPDMLPSAGGTFGTGPTTAIAPQLASPLDQSSGFANGWPVIDNFYPFPQPIIWSPSGETDSNLNVAITLQRQQVLVETARAAAAGVAAFAPPTAAGQFGSFVDIMARLHCQQLAPRSVNQ